MKISEKGVAFIAAHEGVVSKAYRDTRGVWTIGVGHTASAGPPTPVAGMRVTRDEALAIFVRDLSRFEARVDQVLPNSSEHVSDGATSFDFNTGAINRASWVRLLVARDYKGARAAFLAWNKPPVVRNRRSDEARLPAHRSDGLLRAFDHARHAEVRGCSSPIR